MLDEQAAVLNDLDTRGFVVVHLEAKQVGMNVGFRRLGRANLKGLADPIVYEMIDADRFPRAKLSALASDSLVDSCDRLFSANLVKSA